MLRTLPDIFGRSRRRFRDRLRYGQERGAVRVVVREVHRGSHNSASAGAFARRLFYRGWRQHAAAVDAEQGTEEHSGTRRFVREDQTQDSVRRDRPVGRVRVLRHEHGRHHEDQTEPLAARRRGRRGSGAGRLLRQVSGDQETRRPGPNCGTVQQRHNFIVPGRGRLRRRNHDCGFGRRCRGDGETETRRRPPRPRRQVGDPVDHAHAPVAGGPEDGKRRLVRDQHTADEKQKRRVPHHAGGDGEL